MRSGPILSHRGIMAKRKTTRKAPAPRARVTKQGGVVVVQTPAAQARSVVRKQAKRFAGHAGSLQGVMQAAALGGYGVGFIEKQFGAQIPQVPLIGRKGAIALGIYMLKPKSKILRDVGIAAAAISGYELAKENKISGWDEE